MRIFGLELDNDIKGLEERKAYMEGLIGRLPAPDLVVLPELALCSYMASQKVWQYADDRGQDASAGAPIPTDVPEAVGWEADLRPQRRQKDIPFHGRDILPGNWLFQHLILKPDVKAGLKAYEAARKGEGRNL